MKPVNSTSPTTTLSIPLKMPSLKVKDEKGMKRVEKFLKEEVCPTCHGTRLSEAARAPKVQGISLDQVCTMPLSA